MRHFSHHGEKLQIPVLLLVVVTTLVCHNYHLDIVNALFKKKDSYKNSLKLLFEHWIFLLV